MKTSLKLAVVIVMSLALTAMAAGDALAKKGDRSPKQKANFSKAMPKISKPRLLKPGNSNLSQLNRRAKDFKPAKPKPRFPKANFPKTMPKIGKPKLPKPSKDVTFPRPTPVIGAPMPKPGSGGITRPRPFPKPLPQKPLPPIVANPPIPQPRPYPKPAPPIIKPLPPIVVDLPEIMKPQPPVTPVPLPPIVNPQPPIAMPLPPIVQPEPPFCPRPDWCEPRPPGCHWWYDWCPIIRFCPPSECVTYTIDYIDCEEADAKWYLGLSGMAIPSQGFGIEAVEMGSPAEKAGLATGMIITSINDLAVDTPEAMAAAIEAATDGLLEMDMIVEGSDEAVQVAVQMIQLPVSSF